jgi:hypothetical protein
MGIIARALFLLPLLSSSLFSEFHFFSPPFLVPTFFFVSFSLVYISCFKGNEAQDKESRKGDTFVRVDDCI